MKLATLNDGSRDGQLIVVSRDLSQAHYASGIAGRLQQVLDDWGFLAPQLEELYVGLNHGRLRHAFNFDPKQCMAPLPRAFQWIEGAAYLNHAEVLHKAGQADSAWEPPTEPGLRQGPGDAFLGACSPVRLASEAMGIDFEAQWVAVTGDVAQGVNAAQALEGVRLLMLANGWTLRLLGAQDRFHSRPLTSFSPVAVTPDELGASWRGGRIDGALQTMWNGRKVGHCETGAEMSFHCGQLIAQAAKTRGLRAGSLISTGPVSNQDSRRGYSCIAEKRALEQLESGQAKTAFMAFGDSVRIEMKGADGLSVFGAIDQDVLALNEASEDAAVPA